MLICDKCGASINRDSKFCPQCGDPVTEADVVKPVSDSQAANVDISFGYSSSPNYSRAVDICKNIPSYSEIGEGKQIIHTITLPLTEVDLVVNIYNLIGSWKSSKMLIKGKTATKKDLTYFGMGCYRNRQKAYKPEQFCFGEREYEANIWGCKRLNMPINQWGSGWLDYGSFDSKQVWHLDKSRIRHELETAIRENELCPVLDRRKVLETLEKLPDSINPKKDKNWEYRTSYEEVNGDYKQVAVGVKPVFKGVNKFVVGSFKPVWEEEQTVTMSSEQDTQGSDHSWEEDGDLYEVNTSSVSVAPVQTEQPFYLKWWFIGSVIVLIMLVFKN
ncbi:zinc ribbon domain-containing protein [Sansalvadorimonas verongulae]|uniref:zinc ribbon domain-containing protein n=1 Tax=Sansalvadorimonas verongulae TaxID=2172824 RepID=UPI001E2BD025|nr:zinc ribbon domain-containing protein [Sansalvadorimonas verongulae]MTI15214.1 zinc ribbon domain-containing protein [Sansalvadorimonas verongulae]